MVYTCYSMGIVFGVLISAEAFKMVMRAMLCSILSAFKVFVIRLGRSYLFFVKSQAVQIPGEQTDVERAIRWQGRAEITVFCT